MEGSELLIYIIPGFFLFFTALWLGIIKLLAVFGWSKYVDDRAMITEPPPDAQKFSMQTMTIGGGIFFPINYANCLNGWVHSTGVFLRPAFMFKLFHPMLHYRWNQIESVEPATAIMSKRFKMTVRRDLRPFMIYGALGKAVHDGWMQQRGRQSGSASI